MNLRQLQCFHSIVEQGSFSKAAAQLFMTQSAASQQINALEREINRKLLIRTPQKIELTPAGRWFYEQTCEAVRQLCWAASAIQFYGPEETRRLTIGYYASSIENFIDRLVNAFLKEYPSCTLNLLRKPPHELTAALAKREIDCAVLAPDDIGASADAMSFTPLCTLKLYGVMRPDHPLAAYSTIAPEQLRGYTAKTQSIPLWKTLSYIAELLKPLEADGLPFEIQDGTTEMMLVRSSKLVMLRPSYAIPEGNFKVIPLQCDYNMAYGIGTLGGNKALVDSFIQVAAKAETRKLLTVS